MAPRKCRCGNPLPPRQPGQGGQPRRLCDACRRRHKVATPDWSAEDGSVLAAVNREIGWPERQSVNCSLARRLAATLDGLPNNETTGAQSLIRTLEQVLAGDLADQPRPLDEFTRRRLQRTR